MADETTTEQGQLSPLQKSWVKFEENNTTEKAESSTLEPAPSYSGAVIDTETVQINFDQVKQQAQAVKTTEATEPNPVGSTTISNPLSDVNLSGPTNGTLEHTVIVHPGPTIQRGFANGDVIVSVLPVNNQWPWVTPAEFRPELVPEELMAEGLSLTVEEYVQTVETLVHDVRFSTYNICYKRLLMAWLLISFFILLGLLFSCPKGLPIFGCGVVWLIINAVSIFVCMWFKNKMNRGLEKAVAKANRFLIRHRILLGVDDRGKLSCHKTHLCFIYMDTTDCIRKLQQLMDSEEGANSATEGDADEQKRRRELRTRMDIDDTDIVVTGANPTRISRKQERASLLLLRYSQRWIKALFRNSLDLGLVAAIQSLANRTEPPKASPSACCIPRHAATVQCPCQFIEAHLYVKAHREKLSLANCCSLPDFN